MSASYSQFGEDVLVRHELNAISNGFYVDVGCFHPVKWSNTYAYYRMGWQGVCIDPNSEYSMLWKKWRPRDRFLNLAVSDTPGELHYLHRVGLPQENRIVEKPDETHEDADLRSVPAARLDDVLDKYLPKGKGIDLLSVDCEGHDLQVLRSNDFERFRPRIVLVEDHDGLGDTEVHRYCVGLDYRLIGFCTLTRAYKDNRSK